VDLEHVSNEDFTYTQTVLEGHASNSQGLEQFRDGLATCLRVASSTGCGLLGRSEIGNALSGLDGDIGPSHFEEYVLNKRRYLGIRGRESTA
jgi:hypothetical protein